MIHGPKPIGPWALARTLSQGVLMLKSNVMPKPMLIKYELVGVYLLRIAHDLGSSVLPWGILLPSNLLEAGTSPNATISVFNEAYSLPGIIKLDHTHK